MVTERLKTIITQDTARFILSTGPDAAGKEVGEGAAAKDDVGSAIRGLGNGEAARPASTTTSTRIPAKSSAIPPPSRVGQSGRETGTRPTGTENVTSTDTHSADIAATGKSGANVSRTAATLSARAGRPPSSPAITATAGRKKIPQRAGGIRQSTNVDTNRVNETRRAVQESGHAGPSRDPNVPKDRSSGSATHASASNSHDRHRQVDPSRGKRNGPAEVVGRREAVVQLQPKVEEMEESDDEEQVQPGKVAKVRNHPPSHMFRDTDTWIYASFCGGDRSAIVV